MVSRAVLPLVTRIRDDHPDWAGASIPILHALLFAHDVGEYRSRTYPTVPLGRARAWNLADTMSRALQPRT